MCLAQPRPNVRPAIRAHVASEGDSGGVRRNADREVRPTMQPMRLAMTAALWPLLLCAGCGGSDSGRASSSSAPKATATVTVTATPSTPPGVLRLGETAHYKWGNVTALDTKREIAPDKTLPGSKTWMGVLVKSCVTAKRRGKQVTLGWGAWNVADRQGGQYEAFAWTGVTAYPSPVYPMDRTFPVGQCAKGWIVFNKPDGVRPMKATYAPSGDEAVVWRF